MKILHMAAVLLAVVGAVNWGLVGAGWLAGNMDWNVVHLVLGSWPTVEAVVYVLVGLAGIWVLITHKKDCAMCSSKM